VPQRILIAKPGLDGHDRGAKVIALALRDAGFEVIYTGLHRSPESIAAWAVQEDVDLIGLSVLSGAHILLTQRLLAVMAEAEVSDIPVVLGGVISPSDASVLIGMGVKAVFPVHTPLPQIIDEIRAVLKTGGEQ
jgi:methylmalonyl-CoA mutase C-terminal domain/subunit